MSSIATTLWFDGNIIEAAAFYTSLFEDAEIQTSLLSTEKKRKRKALRRLANHWR